VSEEAEAGSIPWNWRLAGRVHGLPEFRGRDRLERLLIGRSLPPAGTHSVTIGPGLRWDACFRDDGSCVDLFFLQYRPPSLVPVLEATLAPGGTMFDVGANIGVYAGWAAWLVGPTGRVHAFEPVPATRARLERFVASNGLHRVTIVAAAVGAAPGSVTLHVVPHASGLASAVGPATPEATPLDVPLTSLDAYLATQPDATRPSLVKIDVEGFEFEVLRGAKDLLGRREAPVVLFESQAAHLARAGAPWPEVVRWLAGVGYATFGLLPAGLVRLGPDTPQPRSLNTLALDPARHATVFERLSHRRFPRNQSC